jgi:hypothetical protein
VYASGLHTPLNKIGADNGLPYEVIIILVFMSILLYMFTKNVLVSAFYLIASYISLGYVTIATLSFMLTNSIIIGLVIVGVYLVRKGSSEKYVKVGRIITSVIITIGLMIGLAGNISYSLSNKIEQHVRATNYSSPQALRSSGKVMSESVSSDFMAASPVENKISITSWKIL